MKRDSMKHTFTCYVAHAVHWLGFAVVGAIITGLVAIAAIGIYNELLLTWEGFINFFRILGMVAIALVISALFACAVTWASERRKNC